MRQWRDDDYSRIVSRFDEIPEVVHRNARMQQLRIDQPAKPAHASCQAHLVQVDCTRKQVAYQMFSSASHLTKNEYAGNKESMFRCCKVHEAFLAFRMSVIMSLCVKTAVDCCSISHLLSLRANLPSSYPTTHVAYDTDLQLRTMK